MGKIEFEINVDKNKQDIIIIISKSDAKMMYWKHLRIVIVIVYTVDVLVRENRKLRTNLLGTKPVSSVDCELLQCV